MNSVNSVQQSNVNFTCLKSFNYRRAGLKEQKKSIGRLRSIRSNNKVKPTLLERIIGNKFFPKCPLKYRLNGIREQKYLANV